MPKRDGTGPYGNGPMTGRGLGPCGAFNQRRGYGRRVSDKTDKEILKEEKDYLKNRLKDIEQELEDN